MEQIRIGVIGLGWRLGVTKYWHQPDGRSPLATLEDGLISALVCMKVIESAKANIFKNIAWEEREMQA